VPEFERPENPEFLIKATFRLFGEACLRCGEPRPLEMAHVAGWPECVALAGAEVNGMKPPRDWQYAVAVSSFHNLGNVVPLCCNCHTLFDIDRYPDVTTCDIVSLRDAAVQQPRVLAHLIDFVGTELRGRPNRCVHKTADGKRQHSHQIDELAALIPMPWIAAAHRWGDLTANPHMIVTGRTNDGWHHHVRLDLGAITHCSGALDACAPGAHVWSPSQRQNSDDDLAASES
jgi:hypothetical protein